MTRELLDNPVRLPTTTVAQTSPFPSLTWNDYRLLVDSVVDYAIYMLDVEGRVVSWNLGAKKIKGYASNEIIGQHISRFYLPEDVAAGRPIQALETARRLGRMADEGWRVHRDGSRFWASVVITALRGENNMHIGFAKVTRDLTDQRRAENELRESEERFRLLVENVVDYAIYMLDPEGRVTTWNLGAERMKGYAANEVIGQRFDMFFPEEDAVAGKPSRELATARVCGRFEDEGWRIRKGGMRFWANAIVTALHDPQGRLIGYAKITRDLTQARQAEETERRLIRERTAREVAQATERHLRESEERYRALSRRLEIVLEGVADGITVQDRSGKLVFANNAAALVCGFSSPGDLMNTPPAEVVDRFEILDEQGQVFPASQLPGRRVLAGEPTCSVVLHVRERHNRAECWYLVRASGVTGADGKPEMAVNIWHDVTAERRQERQTRYLADVATALGMSLQSDEMLSKLARVLAPGLADWCMVHVLEGDQLRGVAVAHADPDKLAIAKTYQQRFLPDPNAARGVWNVARTGETQLFNEISDATLVALVRSPEQLELLQSVGIQAVLLVPIRIPNRIMGVLSLISTESNRHYGASDVALVEELGLRAGFALENARLYAAAQASAKAAEEASRAKDEFLAMVSHELRTPLSAIVGWSALLKERVTEPAIAKPVEVIYRNAEAQVKIIDDILDVSRVTTGKFRLDAKPMDLVKSAREAIEVVRPSAAAKNIRIDFTAFNDFCFLVADPERLQQVVWNLLSNAVKFTDAGGRIRISILQQASNVELTVADTGKGIESTFLPFVFERFRQADSSVTRRVGGLGLGLALVRHIVELHGGRVVAASEGLAKGATFTITLPIRAVISSGVETAAVARFAPRKTMALNGIRLLVVDDEPDARELIATALTEAGALVEVAASAPAAFDAFQSFRPDVLISDIGMADEDGFSLMRRIRALPTMHGGKVPSLALTALVREEDRLRSIGAGFTTHIGKPVNPNELVSVVAALAALSSRPSA